MTLTGLLNFRISTMTLPYTIMRLLGTLLNLTYVFLAWEAFSRIMFVTFPLLEVIIAQALCIYRCLTSLLQCAYAYSYIFIVHLTKKCILVKCDNDNVVKVLNSGRDVNLFLGEFARNIWMEASLNDIDITYIHILGKDNKLADILST